MYVLSKCVYVLIQTTEPGPSCGWSPSTISSAVCLTTWTGQQSMCRFLLVWLCQLPEDCLICTWQSLALKVSSCYQFVY